MKTTGTLEMERLFERSYGAGSRRFVCEALGYENHQVADALERLSDKEFWSERAETLSDTEKMLLVRVLDAGGTIRGENLRRELLLEGGQDATPELETLVRGAWLLAIPNSGEVEMEIEDLLKAGTFLQRDLSIPGGSEAVIEATRNLQWGVDEDEAFDVEPTIEGRIDLLEINILHVTASLMRQPLKLNKNGAPNRRSLLRFASGLVMPGRLNEAGEEFDLYDLEHFDFACFVVALTEELGFAERVNDELIAKFAETRDHFHSEHGPRERKILESIRAMRHWQCLPPTTDNDDALGAAGVGEPFIGLRGYIVSVLKRARFDGWFRVSSLVKLSESVDKQYFDSLLGSANTSSEKFVTNFALRTLSWSGIVDLHDHGEELQLIRLTPRGKTVLGMETAPNSIPEPCIVVQPNMEIMVFLDVATPKALLDIYSIAERRQLADRVATFALTPESVQRGMVNGATATELAARLSELSHVPIPPSLETQLADWERIHQRVTFYHGGIMVRHRDPDRLDLMVDELLVDRNTNPTVMRLGATAVYITGLDPVVLQRFVDRQNAHDIDYEGDIPGCLEFGEPLVAIVDPLELDLVTAHTLRKFAARQDDGPPRKHAYKINVVAVQKHWPNDTYDNVCEFLDSHSKDGLPAAHRIALLSAIEGPPTAEVRTSTTILEFASEVVGNLIDDAPEFVPFVVKRLGPAVFEVRADSVDELKAVLANLGVEDSG